MPPAPAGALYRYCVVVETAQMLPIEVAGRGATEPAGKMEKDGCVRTAG